ncbi:hypothetical protein KO465_05075 [Candidatus Micrarchaeota archaeon]|nr:hypothetical protein [Candidatus Micrarchaeota archaeon]
MYHGILVDHALDDPTIIKKFKILGTRKKYAWTLYLIEISDLSVEDTLQEIQKNLKSQFYIHFYKGHKMYVIYKNKIFIMDPYDKLTWRECIQHGLLERIPLDDLKFAPCTPEDEKKYFKG